LDQDNRVKLLTSRASPHRPLASHEAHSTMNNLHQPIGHIH